MKKKNDPERTRRDVADATTKQTNGEVKNDPERAQRDGTDTITKQANGEVRKMARSELNGDVAKAL